MTVDYEIAPHGDAALLVTFGDRIDPLINRRVHAAAAAVRAASGAGASWSVPIPAYASLLVGYQAVSVDFDIARRQLGGILDGVVIDRDVAERAVETVEITVSYGGEDGPDLDAVAERCALTPARVIELHSSVTYVTYMLGFAPGFAYLGELPAELELARRETPRQRVPAGSVAIAGRQTAVYPASTPGGWHLIGRTDAVVWDPTRTPPALIQPGTAVRFVPNA